LETLGVRLQFRSVGGFGERVVFRELFPKGLTLLDLRDDAVDVALTMSHVAARQELRALLNAVTLSVEQHQASTDSIAADPVIAKGPTLADILAAISTGSAVHPACYR
jgi:hypothetical protein